MKIKLLYLWIMCSRNQFIKEKGFNIAGGYEFNYNEEAHTITYKPKKGYINGFWNETNNIISDLTVIVGSNGSGKSTLLSEIMRYSVIVPHEVHNAPKSEAEKLQRLIEKKIVVYEEDGNIYFDHNIEHDILCSPSISRKKMDLSKDCTKIFASNSVKNPVNTAIYHGENILDYALTDLTIADQASFLIGKNEIPSYMYPTEINDQSRYYDDPDTHRTENEYINRIHECNDLISIKKDAYIYLNNLIKLFFYSYSKKSNYFGNRHDSVKINVKNIKEVLNQGFDTEDVGIMPTLSKLIEKYQWKNMTVLQKLISHYFLEIQSILGIEILQIDWELNIDNVKKIQGFLSDILLRRVEESLNENMTFSEYLYNAAEDIILFAEVEANNKIIDTGWDKNDLAFYKSTEVYFDNPINRKFIDRLFLFFSKQIPSIYLRYLNFEFDDNSSGEDALLNLYSRIFWIFNAQQCKPVSLLLVDEIDLYMHPKWQRELINNLIANMGTLIGDENKAQIIISTHSPIILSDIPSANVIYLKNQNETCVIEINRNYDNTFANNIHTLYLNSFFLNSEGTMGAYAEMKINLILSKLRERELASDDNHNILNLIKIIGDDLIRKKLLELYNEKFNSKYVMNDERANVRENKSAVEMTITVLQAQVEQLLAMIQELERIKND